MTIEYDGALGRLICAGEDLHQRALARAVFAHQTMAFALVHIERKVGKRAHAGEFLYDSPHFKNGRSTIF